MISKTDVLYEIRYNLDFKPEQAPTASVKKVVIDNQPSFILRNHETGDYYEIDDLANTIWELIDGKRSLQEILEEVEKTPNQVGLQRIKKVVLFFAEEGCLKTPAEETSPESRVTVVSPFEIDIVLVRDGKKVVGILHKGLKSILNRPLLWLGIFLILAGVGVFANTFTSMFNDERSFQILNSTVVGYFYYYFVLLFPVIVIHEMSHALALFHYGGDPKEIGSGLYYFGPMFYTETSDVWNLDRRQRIMVSAAGGISTLLIGSAAALTSFLLPLPDSASKFLIMLAFWCFYVMLFNFDPTFETDGYYMLMDGLNIPNLREDAFGYLKSTFLNLLKGPSKKTVSDVKGKERLIFVVFGVLCAVSLVATTYFSGIVVLDMLKDLSTMLPILVNPFQASLSELIICLASLVYFLMMAAGFGLLGVSEVKKVLKRNVRFETVNDKKLAVFYYLPPSAPRKLMMELENRMRRASKKLARRFETGKIGSMNYSLLKMGSAEKAAEDIERDMTSTEQALRSAYEDFITEKKGAILKSTGISSEDSINLAGLLKRVSKQIAETPDGKNAKTVASTLIKEQEEKSLHLIASPFGTVWTIEIDPEDCEDFKECWHPSLLIKDLSFTELVGYTARFRKNNILGSDLSSEFMQIIEKEEGEVLSQPDKYQALALFEPLKNSLVLMGRVQELEDQLKHFGTLFFTQAWSGYYSNLLSEAGTNLEILMGLLEGLTNDKSIKDLTLGELCTLNRNLTQFTTNISSVNKSMEILEAQNGLLSQNTEPPATPALTSEGVKVGFLDEVYQINTFKVKDMVERIAKVKKNFVKITSELSNLQETVEKARKESEMTYLNDKSRLLHFYPIALAFLVILLFAYPSLTSFFQLTFPGIDTPQLVIVALTFPALGQIIWGTIYYLTWRDAHNPGRYHTPLFDTTELLITALTELTYPLTAVSNTLNNQV